MSETKFTKGEWVVSDNGYYLDIHVVDEGGYYLDQVCMGVAYDNKGNAPLIAVAPEMYELLESIADDNRGIGDGFVSEIDKLLAKARGEHE